MLNRIVNRVLRPVSEFAGGFTNQAGQLNASAANYTGKIQRLSDWKSTQTQSATKAAKALRETLDTIDNKKPQAWRTRDILTVASPLLAGVVTTMIALPHKARRDEKQAERKSTILDARSMINKELGYLQPPPSEVVTQQELQALLANPVNQDNYLASRYPELSLTPAERQLPFLQNPTTFQNRAKALDLSSERIERLNQGRVNVIPNEADPGYDLGARPITQTEVDKTIQLLRYGTNVMDRYKTPSP
jgi:hypothetical protein